MFSSDESNADHLPPTLPLTRAMIEMRTPGSLFQDPRIIERLEAKVMGWIMDIVGRFEKVVGLPLSYLRSIDNVVALSKACPHLCQLVIDLDVDQNAPRLPFHADTIRRVAENCHKVKKVCVGTDFHGGIGTIGFNDWFDGQVAEIPEWFPSMSTLQLLNMPVDNNLFFALAGHCGPRLTTLDIDRWKRQGEQNAIPPGEDGDKERGTMDAGLIALAEGCPNLCSIELRVNSAEVSDTSLIAIASHCPNLKRFSVGVQPGRTKKMTDNVAHALAKHAPLLNHVELHGFGGVTNEGVGALAAGLRWLHTVSLARTAVSTDGVRLLAERCPRLRSVNLCETDVNDDGVLALVVHCPNLAFLTLIGCVKLTEATLNHIDAHARSLEYVRLSDNDSDLSSAARARADIPTVFHVYNESCDEW